MTAGPASRLLRACSFAAVQTQQTGLRCQSGTLPL